MTTFAVPEMNCNLPSPDDDEPDESFLFAITRQTAIPTAIALQRNEQLESVKSREEHIDTEFDDTDPLKTSR